MTPDLRDLSDVDLADEIIAAAKAHVHVGATSPYSSATWEQQLLTWRRLVAALNEHDRRSNDG